MASLALVGWDLFTMRGEALWCITYQNVTKGWKIPANEIALEEKEQMLIINLQRKAIKRKYYSLPSVGYGACVFSVVLGWCTKHLN